MVLETTQFLIGTILVLSAVLVFIGMQAFITLRDLRKTLHKADEVLDEEKEILEAVSLPIKNFSTTVQSIGTLGRALAFLFGSKKGKKVAKELSSHGREVLVKVEEMVKQLPDEYESEYEETHPEDLKNGNGETLSLSPLLMGRRFFKGIHRKR